MMKNQQSIKLVLSLFLFSQLISAEETSHVWLKVGPQGGSVNHFGVSPNYPDTLYTSVGTGSFNKQYLKSSNGGSSWVTIPFNTLLGTLPIIDVAVDSIDPYTLFATTGDSTFLPRLEGNALLKSKDGGVHWYQIAKNLGEIVAGSFIILNTPFDHTLQAWVRTGRGNDLGIAVSNDGGEQWELTDKRVNNTGNILLARDSADSNILYASHLIYESRSPTLAGLYKSINGGINWMDISPPNFKVRKIITVLNNSNKLYALFRNTAHNIIAMMSINGGKDWKPLSAVFDKNSLELGISELFVDPSYSYILYASLYSRNKIAKSIDSGKNWQLIDISPYNAKSITINSNNNQKLLINSSYRGVISSENGGLNWQSSNKGIRFVSGDLITDRGGKDVMYFDGFATYYKTLDAGKHWEEFSINILHEMGELDNKVWCDNIILNPKKNKEIICTTFFALFKSIDSGRNWALVFELPNPMKPPTFILKPTGNWITQVVYAIDGKTIYVVSDGVNKSIYKSLDSGATWNSVSNLMGKLTIHPENASILYNISNVNGSVALYQSINGGENWKELIRSNHPFKHKLVMHPTNPERLVFNDGGREFLLTDDGGKSWKEILSPFNKENQNTAFPHAFTRISSLVFSPINLDGLVAVTEKGTFESADLGEHWDKVNMRFNEKVPSYSKLKSTSNTVYLISAYGIFNLIKKPDNKKTSTCLFDWAEQQYPDIFSSALKPTHNWGGYNYRYYSDTNTYLGFFHEQEVHMLQPDVSDTLSTHGSVDFYLNLALCN